MTVHWCGAGLSAIPGLRRLIKNGYDVWATDNNGFNTYTDYIGKDYQNRETVCCSFPIVYH